MSSTSSKKYNTSTFFSEWTIIYHKMKQRSAFKMGSIWMIKLDETFSNPPGKDPYLQNASISYPRWPWFDLKIFSMYWIVVNQYRRTLRNRCSFSHNQLINSTHESCSRNCHISVYCWWITFHYLPTAWWK